METRLEKTILLKGGLSGSERVYRSDKQRLIIGSIESADIRVVGDGIAPIHAVLEVEPSPTIFDLASETGVFVNSRKVISETLKSGDRITVGHYHFVISFEEVDEVRSKLSRTKRLNPDEDFSPLLLEDPESLEPIFDYRADGVHALEVVMSWHGTILNVSHFISAPVVTVGGARSDDFIIPSGLVAQHHPLVKRMGSEYEILLDPAIKGVLQSRGAVRSFESLRQGASQVALRDGELAKLSIGECDFFLRYTEAPPRLKRSRILERDPLFRKVLSTSLVLTSLVIYTLSTFRVVQNLEGEAIPERIATILYQPEKYGKLPKFTVAEKRVTDAVRPAPVAPAPVPAIQKIDVKPQANLDKKPIPKELTLQQPAGKKAKQTAQRLAKEGQGAKAKGNEGLRGTKTARSSGPVPQDKAAAPSPNAGVGAGGGNSQVADVGNVDFLKGSSGKIENILGNAGAQLGKSGSSLKGLGGFATSGKGGAALSGEGKGGGGSADLSAGIGSEGRGFGRVGTGLGAAGTGNEILGGQARVAIRTGGNEETLVMGSIDADAIDAAIRAHQDEFRLCYEREINAEHPNLGGRVGTSFVIGATGRVNEAGIESTSLKNPNVERCILGVLKRIDFPTPRGGGVVQVTYPFKFSPVGK